MFKIAFFIISLSVTPILICSCKQSSSTLPSNTVATEKSSPTPLVPIPQTPTPTEVKKVNAEDLAKAADILSANTEHYAKLFRQGKEILGTKPYPNAYAGLAALDDPSSRASKFLKFNNSMSSDMSFGEAFKEAYAFFTVDNAPDSITKWQEDMMDVATYLSSWSQAGVSWQVDGAKAPKLHELEGKFNAAIAKAKADVAFLRKGQ